LRAPSSGPRAIRAAATRFIPTRCREDEKISNLRESMVSVEQHRQDAMLEGSIQRSRDRMRVNVQQ
jgi:hypothetical protein